MWQIKRDMPPSIYILFPGEREGKRRRRKASLELWFRNQLVLPFGVKDQPLLYYDSIPSYIPKSIFLLLLWLMIIEFLFLKANFSSKKREKCHFLKKIYLIICLPVGGKWMHIYVILLCHKQLLLCHKFKAGCASEALFKSELGTCGI